MIDAVWEWLTTQTPLAPTWVLLLSLILGGVSPFIPHVWKHINLLATWVHEAGHALFALLFGREVTRITIAKDASGETTHVGTHNPIVLTIVSFAGYPAPSLAGWGIITAVTAQNANIAVGVMILIAILFLPLQRSLIAILLTMGIAGAGLLLSQISSLWLILALTLLSGYLLAASPKTILTLYRARKTSNPREEEFHSDSTALASFTKIPALLWEIFFLFASCYFIYLAVKEVLAA